MSAEELLTLARSVALEAADLVRERSRGTVEVAATKTSPIDVVTEADRASERLIYDRLMQARPGDGFIGEEGASSESGTGVEWVVDPIDGTVNFLYGIPQFAVSIAARRDSRVVAGVVVNVGIGEVFAATLGGGATLDGRPLRVREPVQRDRRLMVTGYQYRREVRALQAPAVARLVMEVRDVRRAGSAALDLCGLAAGRCDGYVEEGLHAWDMAAGGLIASEAGARVGVLPGAGGTDCVVAAPEAAFADTVAHVRACGFLAD